MFATDARHWWHCRSPQATSIAALARGSAYLVRDKRVDNPDYNNGHQNEYPIGNLNARYRCFLAEPFHGLPPRWGPLTWQPPMPLTHSQYHQSPKVARSRLMNARHTHFKTSSTSPHIC